MEASGDIRILIVEDELIIAEDIRTKLTGLGYNVTGIAMTADEAEQLLESARPDIVMLDILLKGERDGIDLARIIKDHYKIPFIFLTSYADRDTVERARSVLPDGYLLKPFTDKDLFTAIEVAIFRKSAETEKKHEEPTNKILQDCIFIRKDYFLIKIKFDDLMWIRSDGNYLELYCREGKKHLIRSPLKDFLNKLPPDLFLQVHKSYAVNIKHIDAIEYTMISVENKSIPVGRKFIDEIRKTLGVDL